MSELRKEKKEEFKIHLSHYGLCDIREKQRQGETTKMQKGTTLVKVAIETRT